MALEKSAGQDREWIRFKGAASLAAEEWTLVPHDDLESKVVMAKGDVVVSGGMVKVRRGARAILIEIARRSLSNTDPIVNSKPACAGGKSRCVGGLEYCCSDELSGPCDGRWNKCDPYLLSDVDMGVKLGSNVLVGSKG